MLNLIKLFRIIYQIVKKSAIFSLSSGTSFVHFEFFATTIFRFEIAIAGVKYQNQINLSSASSVKTLQDFSNFSGAGMAQL